MLSGVYPNDTTTFSKSGKRMRHNVTVVKHDTATIVVHRWFTPTVPMTVIVPAILLGVPVFVIANTPPPVGNQWISVAICSLIWGVSTYCYAAKLLNVTVLKIDDSYLSVSHSPLPWWPRPVVQRSVIKGVIARSRVAHQNDEGVVSETATGEVVAIREDSEIVLLSNLTNIDTAYEIAVQVQTVIKCKTE